MEAVISRRKIGSQRIVDDVSQLKRSYCNHIQKRLLLEKVLGQESKAVHASSLEVLKEFESIEDGL